jgi:GNAT superfamily N-acetyltransferase
MISIRPANANDIDVLISFDLIARRENERREFIRRVVNSGECFVAAQDEKVIGYAVLNYTFYHIVLTCFTSIHSGYRRSGAGAALVQHLESLCQTPNFICFHKSFKFADAIIACQIGLRVERSDSHLRRRRSGDSVFQEASLK